VPQKRLELPRIAALVPKNSAPHCFYWIYWKAFTWNKPC